MNILERREAINKASELERQALSTDSHIVTISEHGGVFIGDKGYDISELIKINATLDELLDGVERPN